MQFDFRNAPEWFFTHIDESYGDELHRIQKEAGINPESDPNALKQLAVDFFTNKGFTVWLSEDNKLWFDVDEDSPQWTFEILRN